MATITAAVPRRRLLSRTRTPSSERKMPWRRQLVLQVLCLFVAFTVLFPVLWIVSLAVDPRGLTRPDGLNLIPPGATLKAFQEVLVQPTSNPISFLELAFNSFKLAIGTAIFSVMIGVFAAYAFSRLQFRGRQLLMLAILAVLMLPAAATLAPLFVQLNAINIGGFNLRQSLVGVGLAIISGLLPFAIWNLKGYLDTIPKELEEAAAVDGANRNQTFIRIILPLAVPALAVTAFLGFVAGWTEFFFTTIFLPAGSKETTLAVALNMLVGQFATTTPWSKFSAFAIMFALPVSVVYLLLQKYIVSGLAVGGVKG